MMKLALATILLFALAAEGSSFLQWTNAELAEPEYGFAPTQTVNVFLNRQGAALSLFNSLSEAFEFQVGESTSEKVLPNERSNYTFSLNSGENNISIKTLNTTSNFTVHAVDGAFYQVQVFSYIIVNNATVNNATINNATANNHTISNDTVIISANITNSLPAYQCIFGHLMANYGLPTSNQNITCFLTSDATLVPGTSISMTNLNVQVLPSTGGVWQGLVEAPTGSLPSFRVGAYWKSAALPTEASHLVVGDSVSLIGAFNLNLTYSCTFTVASQNFTLMTNYTGPSDSGVAPCKIGHEFSQLKNGANVTLESVHERVNENSTRLILFANPQKILPSFMYQGGEPYTVPQQSSSGKPLNVLLVLVITIPTVVALIIFGIVAVLVIRRRRPSGYEPIKG